MFGFSFNFLLFVGFCQTVPDEQYGYVEVRSGAHMFWWFYGSTNSDYSRNVLPVVLWLQGGPGAGGSGYGNFGEIGQLDEYLNPRNYSWTNKVNLLFIDSPVGSGYSYVDNPSLYTTNNSQISQDLLTCHISLTKTLPFLKDLPYWIFSESYGGKMTAAFANVLYDSIVSGDIVINLQGVMLGDSWISGISYVNTWSSYLYALTLLDDMQKASLDATANECQQAINNNNWELATSLWGLAEGQVENYTNNVDFYYVLQFDFTSTNSISNNYKLKYNKYNKKKESKKYYSEKVKYEFLYKIDRYLASKKSDKNGGGINESQIDYIMNGPIKDELNSTVPSSVVWGGQSGAVFDAQTGDFMKPVINEVDKLLQRGLIVNVWNGQLDLICCTLGTLEWIEQMNWSYISNWQSQNKIGYKIPNGKDIGYFKKSYRNFNMYFMMKSGHMVPADNPIAATQVLCDIVDIPF